MSAALALVTATERSGRETAELLEDAAPKVTECRNWRRGLRLELPDGSRVPVPCKSPNACTYCGYMVALENGRVLRIDAETEAPSIGVTLTTRRAVTDAELREATAQLWRAIRRRYGRVEYCGFVEWTTGEGPRSGGKRRIHVHYTVKGLELPDGHAVTRADSAQREKDGKAGRRYSIPCRCAQEQTCLECFIRAFWREHVGAWVVEARPLRTPAGAIAYLTIHHSAKESQRPPRGWKGKRFRPSQGYFSRPIRELRDQARRELAAERAKKRGESPRLREQLPAPSRGRSLGRDALGRELREQPRTEVARVRSLLAPRMAPHREDDEGEVLPLTWIDTETGELVTVPVFSHAELDALRIAAAQGRAALSIEELREKELKDWRRTEAAKRIDARRLDRLEQLVPELPPLDALWWKEARWHLQRAARPTHNG